MYVSHRWNNFCLRKAGGSRLIQSVEEQERNAEYWHFGNFLWTKWQWESEVKHCVVTTHTRLCLKFKCDKWKWSFAKRSSSGESHSLFFPPCFTLCRAHNVFCLPNVPICCPVKKQHFFFCQYRGQVILRHDSEHDCREVNFVGSLYEFYIWFSELALLNIYFC